MGETIFVAEFDSPATILAAAERVRELGFGELDAVTPFPIAALERPLRVGRSRLRWAVLLVGLGAAALAFWILHWTNAVDYPLNVGGRPLDSYPTDVPIVFESAVLGAASAAFAGVLLGARLPRLHHPLFELEGFERTTVDRFWLLVANVTDATDAASEEERGALRAELERMGARSVRTASRQEVRP